ncbi:uncharacterized protein LOC134791742 [Cydia splendana]|uniref:uncharacterized protein LOC134791742 n=1 Tax=Cydia splendana TaxID=1100963 RepID=UPI0028F4A950
MKFLILLLVLRSCVAFDLPRCKPDFNIDKDQYTVSDTYHLGDAVPTDAHYDVYGNLFYVKSGSNDDGYYYDIYVVKFKTTTAQKIKGLPEGLSYSVAVDKKDAKVYFGTEKGMFRYDYETHNATQVSDSLLKINMIFVDKDGNKYITNSNNGIEELYLLDGEKKIRFNTLEALNELAIDDNNNFYFIKHEQLFVLKPTLYMPLHIGNVTYTGAGQISFHKDNVFVASDHLVYFHENETGKMKLISNVPDQVTSIAFDRTGDFVLGTRGKLLKYKKNECYIRKTNDAV